jgi:hypothetical protein
MRRVRLVLVSALLPVFCGCTVMAAGGAVVGAGVTVASTAASAGVAVGKGVVNVATAPFSDDDDKEKK